MDLSKIYRHSLIGQVKIGRFVSIEDANGNGCGLNGVSWYFKYTCPLRLQHSLRVLNPFDFKVNPEEGVEYSVEFLIIDYETARSTGYGNIFIVGMIKKSDYKSWEDIKSTMK